MNREDIEKKYAKKEEELNNLKLRRVELMEGIDNANKKLPLLRELAYPKENKELEDNETNLENKEQFKVFLEKLGKDKKELNNIDFHLIKKAEIELSAIRYFLITQEKMKELLKKDNVKILSINLTAFEFEEADSDSNIDLTIYENRSGSFEMVTKTLSAFSQELIEDVRDSNIILTFSRENELEKLRKLGVTEATIDNKDFRSIHHTSRFFSDFDRKPFSFYTEMFKDIDDIEANNRCNSQNILKIYLKMIGI
jgi:hypothetical protein